MFNILKKIVFLTYVSLASNEKLCGNWESFRDEKCFKVINDEKLVTNEDAIQLCSQSENGSTLITIHSKEEQEFIEKYIFETLKIDENFWLGLKNSTNKFEWIDKTSVAFTNWANGSPGNITDHKCVEMSADITPIGKWVNTKCDRKLLTVCQKLTNNYLQKKLFEIQDLLTETQKNLINKEKQLNNALNELNLTRKQVTEAYSKLDKCSNVSVIRSTSFTDSDGKQRAFIFPVNENKNYIDWNEAYNTCIKYNATLVEINSQQKQTILESFLKQLDLNHMSYESHIQRFWLNARKDTSGKFRWLRSENDVTYTNWVIYYPRSDINYDYLFFCSFHEQFGKWGNHPNKDDSNLLCELEINI